MAPPRLARAALAAFAVGLLHVPEALAADEVAVCASAHLDAQKLRDVEKLRDAREKLVACARPACPEPIARQCDKWLTEVDADMPTVILDAKNASGRDVAEVRVSVDDVVFLERLGGQAIPMDPGHHVLRFQHPGSSDVVQDIVLRVTEKNRKVQVLFEAPGSSTARTQGPALPSDRRGPIPTLAWVLGGVGVVAAGLVTVLWAAEQHTYDECRNAGCPDATQSRLRTEQKVAWGAAAVGVVSVGLATWLILDRPTTGGVALDLELGPTRGSMVLRQSF
jgi:hypothetical protein